MKKNKRKILRILVGGMRKFGGMVSFRVVQPTIPIKKSRGNDKKEKALSIESIVIGAKAGMLTNTQ